MFEGSLLIQPKQLLLMVVDKWVNMYLLPLLQLVDRREPSRVVGATSRVLALPSPDAYSPTLSRSDD